MSQINARTTRNQSGLRETLMRGFVSGGYPGRRAPQCVPLAHDSSGSWDERDGALLRQITKARACRDDGSVRVVIGELLDPYMCAVRRLVTRQTRRVWVQQHDREEIASAVMERLARTLLLGKSDFGAVPFGAVVAMNVDWEVKDFLRARARRVAREELTAPEEIPQSPVEGFPALAEQAEAVGVILRPLGVREREIAFERFVLELRAGEVAARRGMRVGAVKMACSRGLNTLRELAREGDVTFSGLPSVSRVEGQVEVAGDGRCSVGSSQQVNLDPPDWGTKVSKANETN